MRIVLASNNAGKLRELEALLAPLAELVSLQAAGVDSPQETGSTFLENALIKARHAAALTGLPALADDSGIEVDFLHGRPGVRSARYAGDHASDAENLRKLLEELEPAAADQRSARYRCVIAYVRHAHDPEPVIGEGTWEGRLSRAPRGTGGFGYDPVFVPSGYHETAAQMDAASKNACSHRGQALRQLLSALHAEFGRETGRSDAATPTAPAADETSG